MPDEYFTCTIFVCTLGKVFGEQQQKIDWEKLCKWALIPTLTSVSRLVYAGTSRKVPSHNFTIWRPIMRSFIIGLQYEVWFAILKTQMQFCGISRLPYFCGKICNFEYIKVKRAIRAYDWSQYRVATPIRLSCEWQNKKQNGLSKFYKTLNKGQERTTGLLAAQWYQNFWRTTTVKGGQFKAKTGTFGPCSVWDAVSRTSYLDNPVRTHRSSYKV